MTVELFQCDDLPLFMQSIPTRADFAAYDERHPEVWLAFEEAALRLIDRGVTHYGAKAIMEYIRYHTALTTGDAFFKCNNNFTAGYARKFVKKYPQHAEFFELRKSGETDNGHSVTTHSD